MIFIQGFHQCGSDRPFKGTCALLDCVFNVLLHVQKGNEELNKIVQDLTVQETSQGIVKMISFQFNLFALLAGSCDKDLLDLMDSVS